MHLNGVNLHSETYLLGNAVFEEIKRLRELGFTFVRMSHYPHSPAFYEACDRYGVAVLDCLAGWQQFYDTDAFKENTYQQVREMVRANRNHPSIVAWEPSLNESSYTEAWAREVNRITKAEYPEKGLAKAWTCGWRYWNVFDMGCGTPQANVNGDAATYATKPVIVSEYGDWNYGGYDSTTRVTREPPTTPTPRAATRACSSRRTTCRPPTPGTARVGSSPEPTPDPGEDPTLAPGTDEVPAPGTAGTAQGAPAAVPATGDPATAVAPLLAAGLAAAGAAVALRRARR